MKTLNIKKQFWMTWGFLFLVLSLNVACNRRDNGNNNIPAAGGFGGQFGAGVGCMNCNFAQVAMGTLQSQGTTSFPATINWQLIGDQNIINQTAMQGMNPQKTYSGPIALQGAMNLGQSIQAGNCMIPAGQYQLNSVQAGMMTGGVIQVPQLVAIVGGAQIIFNLQQAVGIDANGDGQFERLAGMLIPTQGPGFGGMMGYPGQTYPGFNNGMIGGMVSCNDIGVYLQ